MRKSKTLMPSSALNVRHVAILIETDDTWGRNVVESISHYACEFNWQLLISPRDKQRRLRIPHGWHGDGVIALLRDPTLVEHLKDTGLPTVNISGMFHKRTWAGHVATHDEARARMAFDHFRNRQIENFGCYAPDDDRYSNQRAEAFHRVVDEAGLLCVSLAAETPAGKPSFYCNRNEIGMKLASLPRPTGIFAADPYSARQLFDICNAENIDVPGDIAILSGDEDELLCDRILPPISSIELASHRIGLEASKMLCKIMITNEIPQQPLLIDPLRIRSRRSTDCLAVSDPRVAAAVKYIWEQVPHRIRIEDLADIAAMSRRSLEQRFRVQLGRSPAEEIRRARLEKARQLMVTTSSSVASIALECGFSGGPYLAHAFQKQYGITPSEMRIGRRGSVVKKG